MIDLTRRPLPAIDPDTAGFFEAARRGELVVCACNACGATLHLPRGWCHHCGTRDVGWRPVAGTARLWSWTVAERATLPSFPVPYTVVVVDLDDAPGTRLVGYLPGTPELRADMPMRVIFEDLDGAVLPNWVPAEA